ncbi:hypothetical protein CLIB1423_01S11716 [[Candida] railenensis]|uniref:Uncharacterized protein n=1 Tax=[Candida] railenensis TaxID=45579 RepID=A0A9P0QKW2_9ASCO|nr:hypothetical protein CLIB1423_01S11716 [[Candida] railenensis]
MGNCFSRSGMEEPAPTPNKNANNRAQRLKENEGHKLGDVSVPASRDDSKREAARAAEERFQKSQNDLKESQSKLKEMSKKSRADKGL